MRLAKMMNVLFLSAVVTVATLFQTSTAVSASSLEPGWTGEERVTGLKCAPSVDGPVITWDAVPGADGYIIGGIQNGKPYKQIGYTAGTTYTDTASEYKGYCFYWV